MDRCNFHQRFPVSLLNLNIILVSLIALPARRVRSNEFLPMSKIISNEDNFIINLITRERFSECSLFVLQVGSFESGESVDKILESSTNIINLPIKTTYSIKMKISSSSESGESNSKNFSQVRFKEDLSVYPKRRSMCLIVILLLNDIRPESMNKVFKLITPVYMPITRKDEDFYIFKTDFAHHEHLLLMQELPDRVKFKIAVGSDIASESNSRNIPKRYSKRLRISTICFFCGDQGTPTLLNLPLTEQNLPESEFDYFPDFVWNLNGKLLKVSIPNVRAMIEADPPYEGVSNARRGNWKYLFEDYLMVKLNFTYNMFFASGLDENTERGGTGRQLDNGSWIGVVGDLVSGKAELGLLASKTPKRIYFIDWTNTFADTGCLTFVTSQPTRIYSTLALLWPFDWSMWLAIGMSTILCILFMFGTVRLLNNLKIGREQWAFPRQARLIIATYFDQDTPHFPQSSTIRMFVALWIFFIMVITNVYRCKMVTLLAFPVVGKLPKSFGELAFSNYEVGFMKHGDSAINTLRASTDPVYVNLVSRMEIFSGIGLECLEKVGREENYACIGYDFSMRHLRERNLSESDTRNLVFAPASTYNIWLTIQTEGKSIYRMNLDKVLRYVRPFYLANVWDKMDMYENVRKLKLEWWSNTGQHEKRKHVEKESDDLTMKHFIGAFYVWMGCLIIALVAFMIEMGKSGISKRTGIGWYYLSILEQKILQQLRKRNDEMFTKSTRQKF